MKQEIKKLSKIAGPLLVFLFVLISGLSGVVVLGKRTLAVRSDVQEIKKERMVLQERLDELRKFEPQMATISEQKIVLALPPSDPLLVSVSQIRRLAQQGNLFLSDLSVQDPVVETGEELKSITVNFGIQGNQEEMLQFFQNLLYSVPLMDFVTVSVERVNTNLEAQITTRVYWASYPTSLPPIADPIDPLTEAELEIIDRISGFAGLEFEVSSELVAQDPSNKQTSPFSSLLPQETLISEPESQQ